MKISMFGILFLLTRISLISQETYRISNEGILCFNKVSYENLINSSDDEKIAFINNIKSNSTFPSLFKAVENNSNNSTIPNDVLEGLDLIKCLLNSQGVIKIDAHYYKMLFNEEKVYVLHESLFSQSYNDLVNGVVTSTNGVKQYSMEQDVLELVENNILPNQEASDDNTRLFCWSRSAATSKRYETAIYFRDHSDLEYSTFAQCINVTGEPSTNTRLKVELEYLRLGIYFTMYIKGKIQREDGKHVINGDPLWRTADWGVGESRWSINYKVIYRGKCRNDNEVTEVNTIVPSRNDENKAGKVFWDRTTGLNYYCLNATANIYTNRAYHAQANESRFCIENFATQALIITNPRMINSLELPYFKSYNIRSNTNQVCN